MRFDRLARACLAVAVIAAGLAPSLDARADDTTVVTPTARLYNPDGTLAGFQSNEPSLYFLIASGWTSEEAAGLPSASLVAPQDGAADAYDLRLTLRPNYAGDAPLVAQTRKADPNALFFPLPSSVREVTLWLPEALGSVRAELTPDSGISTCVAMYYRLRFRRAQLEALRALARGGVTLQGAVTYEYASEDGVQETTAPLTIRVPEAALAQVTTAPPVDGTAWLSDLLATTALDLHGALDGRYSLGSGISVSLKNSVVRGHVLPGTYRLDNPAPRMVLTPSRSVDFRGDLRFLVPELNFTVSVNYDAALAMTLDLETMRVHVDALDIKNVTVAGVSSPFYTQLLRNLATQRSFAAKVSDALSSELQRRILSQTLFGIDPNF